MKVKDLIKELKKHDGDSEVHVLHSVTIADAILIKNERHIEKIIVFN